MAFRVFLPFFLMLIMAPSLSALERLRPGAGVAYLGLHFIDTSAEGAYNGARSDETSRTDMLAQMVADRFRTEGFALLDLGPIAADLDAVINPADCYGCELRMAAKLGADYVLVGEIQKVSNLILTMNLIMKDVATKTAVRAYSVDIRSNTDDSWRRGMRYILKNHYFRE